MENDKFNDKNTTISVSSDSLKREEAQDVTVQKNKPAPFTTQPNQNVPQPEKRGHGESKHGYLDHSAYKNEGEINPADAMTGELTYEDKVIQKIIGLSLGNVDGLLTVDGGFFSNVAEKLVNTENVTAGINTEVGKKQVAVDLSIVVEYGKDIEDIYKQIKRIISQEVHKMTHLKVNEVNVKVVDIKSKEEYEKERETVQDKVTDAAKKTGEFASEQTQKAKVTVNKEADKMKETTEPRV